MPQPFERSYMTIDKSAWGHGPWQDEPDKLQFIDEATDLDCLVVRGPQGALCGYVGVPPEHPWHGKSYGDKVREPAEDEWSGNIDSIVDVHGGLTYSDSCNEAAAEDKGICHVPVPGRPGDVWWFGFDCAHYMDFAPRMRANVGVAFGDDETYRTVGYVRGECARLAAQLAEATS